jgi:hypothetical protein
MLNILYLCLGIAGIVMYGKFEEKNIEEELMLVVVGINFLVFVLSVSGECAYVCTDEPNICNLCGVPIFLSFLNGLFAISMIFICKLPVHEIIYFSINGFISSIILAFYFMFLMQLCGFDCCESFCSWLSCLNITYNFK